MKSTSAWIYYLMCKIIEFRLLQRFFLKKPKSKQKFNQNGPKW